MAPRSLGPALAFLLLASTLGIFAPWPHAEAAASPDTSNNPRIALLSSGGTEVRALEFDTLIGQKGELGGLGDHRLTAGYRVQGAPNDFITGTATVYYSLNGQGITKAGALTATLTDSTTSLTDTTRTFVGNLPAASFAAGYKVTFMIEIFQQAPGGNPTAVACDVGFQPTGNRFLSTACPASLPATAGFQYFIDVTRPSAQVQIEPSHAEVVGTKTFTGDTELGFTLRAQDNTTQVVNRTFNSPLDNRFLRITFREGTSTVLEYNGQSGVPDQRFDVSNEGNSIVARLPRGVFAWPVNRDIAISYQVGDASGNLITGTGPTFHVDDRDPVPRALSSVSVTPLVVETTPGQPAKNRTGVGGLVKVRVEVEDDNMNTSTANRTGVRARIVSVAPGFVSDEVGLTWVSTVSGTRQRYEGDVPIFNATRAPRDPFRVKAQATMTDRFGNSVSSESGDLGLEVTPGAPVVTLTPIQLPLPGLVGQGPFTVAARAFDDDRPIDDASVKLRIQAVTGRFPNTAGWTAVAGMPNTFEKVMTKTSAGNYTGQIPDPADATVFTYQVRAQDQLGNLNFTPLYGATSDRLGPRVIEVNPQPFRGRGAQTFRFNAIDAPADNLTVPTAGVNVLTGTLYVRKQGGATYAEVPLSLRNGELVADVPQTDMGLVADGDVVEYYVTVEDLLGNVGSYAGATAPKSVKVDLRAPTVTLFEPERTSPTGSFILTALADDGAGSGVARIVFEIRTEGGAIWSVLQNSTSPSVPVCLPPGATYEFRVWAIDLVGNAGLRPPSARPQDRTQVTSPGCTHQVKAEILFPTGGTALDARGGNGSATVRFRAAPTGSLQSAALVSVNLLFSPDDGRSPYIPIARNVPNEGTYNWSLEVPSCDRCRVRLEARLAGSSNATVVDSPPFRIINGDATVDLDGNGVGDQCELQAFGRLRSDPDGDPDDDGLSNRRECSTLQPGTSNTLRPTATDTDGDGASDGVEVRLGFDPFESTSTPSKVDQRFDEWTPWWWIVPGLFVLVLLVFLVGLSRRW